MEPHAFSIEKAGTAIAPIQFLCGNAVPVVLFVVGTVKSACFRICIIVESLSLLESNTVAKRNTGEGVFNNTTKLFSFKPSLQSLLGFSDRRRVIAPCLHFGNVGWRWIIHMASL